MPNVTTVFNNSMFETKYILKFSSLELDGIFNSHVNIVLTNNHQPLHVNFDGEWYVETKDGKIYIDENTEFIYEPKLLDKPINTAFGTFNIPYQKGIYNIPYILSDGEYLTFTILSKRKQDIFAQSIEKANNDYIQYKKELYENMPQLDMDD